MERLIVRSAQMLAMTLLLACCAAGALAVPINYGDFTGTNLDYLGVTENSPTDPTPLFEAPTRLGNSLLFFPTNYAATSSNGVPDVTVGILTFDLEAKNGDSIDEIRITEVGDYQLTTLGSGLAQASVAGALIVTVLEVNGSPVNFDPFLHFQTDSLVASPASPYQIDGSLNEFFEFDIFTATAVVDLASVVPNVTKVQVQFNNILNAASEAGTTAFIQKKSANGAVIVEPIGPDPGPVVPEPGSALMAICSAGFLLAIGVWRRRRR